LSSTGGAATPRPLPGPPRAIENKRLAIEAPRQDGDAAATGHTDPLSRTDPLARTDPLSPIDPAGHPMGRHAGTPTGISDPLRLIDPRRAEVLRRADHRATPALPPGSTAPASAASAAAASGGAARASAPQPATQGRQQQANGQRRLGENTRSVRLPTPAPPGQRALAPPIYRTAAFAFGSCSEYAAVLNDEMPGFSYSRIDNPTVEAFCAAVAALEGVNLSYQATSQAFASGMAAISTVFWAFTRAGSHVIAPSAMYGGSYSFLRNVASNFGVQTDFVDMTDLARVRAAVRPGTSIIYAETLANPTVAVTDLAAIARLAHEAGAMFVVDSTLAPPVICRPLEHGADLVLHSATKYFGGHSDVTGGVVTGHPELIKRLRDVRVDTGGSLGPDDSYLLRRGLETLPLRVRRQCSTAQLLAAGLVRHPAVRAVYYPGLTQHPGHEVARRQFDAGPEGTRFGAIVTVAPFGGRDAGMTFADRLRVAQVATSLGGTQTKVSHAGSTTHRQMDDAALAAAGIDPGSVRFSIGLEDGEDLLADAMAALDSLSRA
jgi:cystathionine beta-lyase/cystathionine gamma-synthase